MWRLWMTELRVTDNAPVKLECGKRFGRGEKGAAGTVGEFGTAAPELQGEIVERVVAVREGREDCSVAVGRGICEEARGLLKFLPTGRRGEVTEELSPKRSLAVGIVEQIGPINETLGTVVPGKRS